MPDVVIVGGGVVGLSIAWELACHGIRTRILEQGGFGREASWAGAGMLPPGNLDSARTGESRLRGAAHRLWPDWSHLLKSFTGHDNGFRQCGGLEVRFADSQGEPDCLLAEINAFQEEGIEVETGDLSQIRRRFPALGHSLIAAYFLPQFRQVRNPRHLQALQMGCAMRRVELIAGSPVERIVTESDRIVAVHAGNEIHRADEFVFAAGAWSRELLGQIGLSVPVEPVKGQMILLKASPQPFYSVIQAGLKYMVPRDDDLILVGSTEERTGFDKRNTAQAVGDLIGFAESVVPSLKDAQFVKCWAGLRPFSGTGKPFIGRLPQFANASLATGHFRHGLHLSPITAVLIRQILMKQPVLLPEECRIQVG